MNFIEAMKNMLEGKKVRQRTWGKNQYIFIKDNQLTDEENYKFGQFNFILDEEFELYQESQESQEELFQWVYRQVTDRWYLSSYLMTEAEAAKQFKDIKGVEYKKLNDVLGNKK